MVTLTGKIALTHQADKKTMTIITETTHDYYDYDYSTEKIMTTVTEPLNTTGTNNFKIVI